MGRQIAFASGAFLGAAGFAAAVTKTIGAASDLNEEINKSRQIFGGSAAAILAWSKTTARSAGLSRVAALQAAGAFGNMLTTIGLASKPAADLSKRMVVLASDLASFNNQDPTEMLDKLRSGLAGEAEPLRRFGILLSEARVKQEAVRIGLVTQGTELTEQEKVLARYSLILKDSSKAHGDFARTSKGLANTQRTLRAEIDDAAASIGKALLPAVREVARDASDFLGKPETRRQIREFSQTVGRELPGLLRDLGGVLRDLGGVLKTVAGGAKDVSDALGGFKNTVKLLIALKVGSVIAGWATNVGLLGDEIGAADGKGALGRTTKLRASLQSLKRIGAISIAVSLIFDDSAKKKIEGFLKKHGIDLDLDKGLIQIFDHKGKPLSETPFFRGNVPPGKPGTKLDTGRVGTTPGLSALAPGAAKGLGSAKVAPGADRGGVPTKGHVVTFVRRIAAIYGAPLTITTGTNHNEMTTTGNVSQHWSGNAADIAMAGSALTRLGQCALIAAGSDPGWARKQSGGAYTVNGVQIIFNSYIGGNHFNHLHVGLNSLPSGFNTGFGSTTTVQPATTTTGAKDPIIPTPKTPRSGREKKKLGGGVTELLPQALRLRIAEAEGTKGIKDDVSALRAASKFLSEALTHTKRNSEKRIAIQEALNQTQAEIDRLTQKDPKKAKDKPLIPVTLRTGLTKAEGTKGLQDDLKALRNIQTFLRGALKGTKGEKRLTILDELVSVKDKIGGIVRDILEKARAEVDRHRGVLVDAFGKVADKALDAFDAKTDQLTDALSATFDKLTPAEQELLGIQGKQRGRERTDLVAEVERTRKRLERATSGRRHDRAQREFDEASEGLRVFDLEPVAEAERAAAETRRDAALEGLRKQREAERQELQDKLDKFRAMLEQGGIDLGTAFAKGLLKSFPEFKKAIDAYTGYLQKAGLTGTAGTGTKAAVPAGMDPVIATAIRNSSGGGTRAFASAPQPVQPTVFVPVVIASDLVEAQAKYQRRNGRQTG